MIPIVELKAKRSKIDIEIDLERWTEVKVIAQEICKLIELSMSPEACRTGKPHIDGVYRVGRQRFVRGTPSAKEALVRMNDMILEYRAASRSKRKKSAGSKRR